MAAKARVRLDGADPINNGLLRFLPLTDGAGGRLVDISPARKNGATVGSTTWPATMRGKSLGVSSGSNYGSVSSGQIVSGLVNWTIALQMQVASGFNATDGASFYCERAASGNDIVKMEGLGASGAAQNVAFFTLRDDAGTLLQGFGTIVINDGRWHDLVLVKRGTSIIYYVDGKPDIIKTWTGTDTFTNSNRSTLGVDLVASATAFTTGNMRCLRLFSRALLPTEVARLYRDPWAGTLRTRRRGYSAANAYSLTLDNVSREYGAGALGLTAARRLALDGVSRVYGAGAANLTVARALALDGVSRVYGAGDITLTKTRPMALDGVSRLYGADDMTMTYDGSGAGPHGVLRRRVRRRLWNDVPEDLKPVVALAEEWADESPVQRAVDEALDRYARISARASIARRDRLVDELKRAIVQAVERAAEADDEEALIALL